MRRAFVGNSVGVKSVMLLVLALVMFVGAGPALAQNMVLKTIQIDYYKNGVTTDKRANGKVLYASAILCASDFDNGEYKDKVDGRVNTDSNLAAVGKSKLNLVLPRVRGHAMSRPMLANMETGDPLIMAAIIEGVTPSDARAIIEGNSSVANSILSMVTADFSAGLFAAHTNSSVYSGVHPNYVTTALAIKSYIDTKDKLNSSNIYNGTTVIVMWDAGLTVSATEGIAAAQNFSATLSINRAANDSERYVRTGVSNFVGVEVGEDSAPLFESNWADFSDLPGDWQGQLDTNNQIGLVPGVDMGIRINEMTDTTSLSLYGGPGGNLTTPDIEPDVFIATSPENVPFQFRKKDLMNIQFQINPREGLDGEPDDYFGDGDDISKEAEDASDPVQLASTGAGSNGFVGAKLSVTAWKTNDNSSVFSSIGVKNPNAVVVSDANGNAILNVSAAIADTVITSGSYRVFKVKAVLSDDVDWATEVYTHHALDVAVPFYTATRALAERASGTTPVTSGDIGMQSTDSDEAWFGVEIDGNGEKDGTNWVKQWLGMSYKDVAKYANLTDAADGFSTLGQGWADNRFVSAGISNAVVNVVSKSTIISNIPVSSQRIQGASIVIKVKNNYSSTIYGGGLIVAASDDARNPAVVYTDSANPNSMVDTLNTLNKTYSVTNFSPLTANTLKPATVEIDNTPPLITLAQLSVTGMPQGYWNGGIESATFDLLRDAQETKDANIVGGGGVLQVIRGTAKTAKQNGSPLRLVVKFLPVSNANANDIGNDVDGLQYPDGSASDRAAGMLSRFSFSITDTNLGYANTAGKNHKFGDTDDARWNLLDATITDKDLLAGTTLHGVGGFQLADAIAWATFEDTKGIPSALGGSESNAKLEIEIRDAPKNPNFPVAEQDTEQNGLIVDMDAPTIAYVAPQYIYDHANQAGVNQHGVAAAVLDGSGTNAATVLYVTDTRGSKIASSRWGDSPESWAGVIKGASDLFYNSSTLLNATAPGVSAGYSIIVSANFTLPATSAGAGGTDVYFTQVSKDITGAAQQAGFPFLIKAPVLGEVPGTLAAFYIDTAGTLYGQKFKTISADFGDFVDQASERDVLPDVVEFIKPDARTSAGSAVPGDVVSATWFYMIDGTKNLRIADSGMVRYIHLNARDLSGNVTTKSIPAATGTFVQPQVTILNYELSIPSRGIAHTVIERDASYLGGVDSGAAFTVSQATANLDNATAFLVAKVGDGITKGGPLAQTKFIQADFRPIGGKLESPDVVTLANGTPVTNGLSLAGNSIIWATWYSETFTDTTKDSGAAKNAQIVVYATASSNGVGEDKGVAIQADLEAPKDVIVGDFREKRAIDDADTAPSNDVSGDGLVRPNQVVSFPVQFTMDTADIANKNLIQIVADLSQFGSGITPTRYLWTDSAAPTHRHATFEFTIPSNIESEFYRAIVDVTDAAGNVTRKEDQTLVTVNASRPEIQSIVLSASNVINYATDRLGVFNDWFDIGTRHISDPANPIFTKNGTDKIGEKAMVRAGDALMVTASIKINDNVFSNLDVTADFSAFSGSAYSAVVPAPPANLDKIIEDGLKNDMIAQATRVAGNIYYATWVHYIQPTDSSIDDASVVITALNPANVAARGEMIYSPPLVIDNKGPVVTQKTTIFKDGKAVSDTEINPNSIAGYQPGRVTAEIVVSATYEDAGIYNGWAQSILTALYDGGAGLQPSDKKAQDALFLLNGKDVTEEDFPAAARFALTRESGVFTNAGSALDGDIIGATSALVDLNVATYLETATHTVLNIWYGNDPAVTYGFSGGTGNAAIDATAVLFKQGIAEPAYSPVVAVSDVIGNSEKDTSVSSLELDGQAPVISTGRDAGKAILPGATIDVAPGQVAYKDYVPAQYTPGGVIQRPTRVSNGTVVRLLTYIWDKPDYTDPVTFSVRGNEFGAKASSFVVYSPAASQRTDSSFDEDNVWQTVIDTSAFADNVIDVSMDITIGLEQKANDDTGSTIPLDNDSYTDALGSPVNGVYPAGSYQVLLADKIKTPAVGDYASIQMDATDTVDNMTDSDGGVAGIQGTVAWLGIEIDTNGPEVVKDKNNKLDLFTSFLPSKAAVDNIFTGSWKLPDSINAGAGSWLVFGATVVIDGTAEFDFPLDKFDINWAEIFEFDTARLEHNNNFKGKKYKIESATRSIIWITNTIKVLDDADPRNADLISYHLEDGFGNVTDLEVPDGEELSISAQGPRATEISLKVDGKLQDAVGVGKLGIGNKWPDSASAAFEIYPGAQVVLEATITTIDGEAPDEINADFGDFYPTGMRNMVDQVIPSVTEITSNGSVYARWEYVAYDLDRLAGKRIPAFAADMTEDSTKWFFDQSNLQGLSAKLAGKKFNGPVKGSTPAMDVELNGIVTGDITTAGGPTGTAGVSSKQAAIDSIVGLPYIRVQQDATAKKVAWVTVFVADVDSLFPAEQDKSALFAVDTEPPRASVIFSVTNSLPIKYRFLPVPGIANYRIGSPTAPNANRKYVLDPAPRVRQNDSVAVIIQVTNSRIDGSGNDAFRTLPGMLPSNLTTGFFRIDASNDASIMDMTADLSGFSTVAGADDVSIFDPNAPVADPAYPNMLTIDSQGTNAPDLITATYTIKVTGGVGTSVVASNDPVEVTPTLVDDAGNLPVDTAYDTAVILNANDGVYNQNTGNDAGWRTLAPQSVLAVDNQGPFISGSVTAQIISGTATVDDPLTGGKQILTAGSLLEDLAVISAGTVLRVTVTVTDQVDHPLDLIIKQNNFGNMKMTAEGLKLSQSRLVAEDAKLSGPDSISVPFSITVPSKETGKSTFSFQFIIQATDTVGNMSQKTSTERFGFDANPDVIYYDLNGQLVEAGSSITVNAGVAPTMIISASALDVGGLTSVEWIPGAAEGITFSAKDGSGNDVADLKLDAAGAQYAQLDLYALIPVGAAATQFVAQASATDIEGNPSAESIVTVNVNQPALIAASLPYSATDDSVIVTTGEVLEITGVGYNTAFADIREVTIEEGTSLSIKIAANDSNVADIVTLSATGTAVTSPAITEGTYTVTSGAGAGEMDFSFTPGYLAVTGAVDMATFELDVTALDGTTIASDSMKLVFNVLAKSATPIVTIESIKIDGNSQPITTPIGTISLNEGSGIEIVYKAQDPGDEVLDISLEPIPALVPAVTDVVVTSEGIVFATFTFEAGLQDADVPELTFDGPFDPLWASFSVANASFSNSKLVPIDIVNVSQAPIITATAVVGIEDPVAVVDGDIIKTKAGDQVVVTFSANDPDGDAVLTNIAPVITASDDYQVNYTSLGVGASSFESMLTIRIPDTVTPENATVTVAYTAGDNTQKQRTLTFQIDSSEEVEPGPGPSKIANLLVAQGKGGENLVNFKNIDPDVTAIDGRTVELTSTYRSVSVARGGFLDRILGGGDREARVVTGDVDGDGDVDVVLSMGHVTEATPAIFPNIVVVKDGKTRQLIGNSFVAFRQGGSSVNYNGGDIHVAVGDFIGSGSDQIAVAQGHGGSGIVRIYQYTGLSAPNGYQVIAQFQALDNVPNANNANGGVTLTAGDVDGDGLDELVCGQTNSDTSLTQFTVLDINPDNVNSPTRHNYTALPAGWRGNGGVNIAVVDLDGNGTNELVCALAGNNVDTKLKNVVSIVIPTVVNNVITGFTRPTGSVRNVLSEVTNPSGGQSIAAIEANGLADGTELVVGTQAILSVDGTTVTPVLPAPEAKYTIVKIGFDGSAVTGVSTIIGQGGIGFPAFPSDLNPTSGAVNVSSGLID